eukprot:1161943-Pelagomonas_calceolata.AAC.1
MQQLAAKEQGAPFQHGDCTKRNCERRMARQRELYNRLNPGLSRKGLKLKGASCCAWDSGPREQAAVHRAQAQGSKLLCMGLRLKEASCCAWPGRQGQGHLEQRLGAWESEWKCLRMRCHHG